MALMLLAAAAAAQQAATPVVVHSQDFVSSGAGTAADPFVGEDGAARRVLKLDDPASGPPAWLPRNPACGLRGCPLPELGLWSTTRGAKKQCPDASVALAEIECQAAALDGGHSRYQFEADTQQCCFLAASSAVRPAAAASSLRYTGSWVTRELTSPMWQRGDQLSPTNSASQNTRGWKSLVAFLEAHPGSVARIPGGVYDVMPLAGATGLINATIIGGQHVASIFRVHNASGVHVAAWSNARGLYLRDLSFTAVGINWTGAAGGETTSGLNWYNVSDSIVEGVSMEFGRMMSMSGGGACSSCRNYNPPVNFHFRRCYSSNAAVGVFLCDSWFSSIETSVAVNITGSPGYGIELKNGGKGNWIADCIARSCKYGFAHGSMNGFVDEAWASNVSAVDCGVAVVSSGSNCVWEGIKVSGTAGTTTSAVELMVNRVGSGKNNTFEILVGKIAAATHGSPYAVKMHQGTLDNVVNVKQWPLPTQEFTAAFIAGSMTEGKSTGPSATIPTCHGTAKECGCAPTCPQLTPAKRVGSGNVVNLLVATGKSVCSGDCTHNKIVPAAAFLARESGVREFEK